MILITEDLRDELSEDLVELKGRINSWERNGARDIAAIEERIVRLTKSPSLVIPAHATPETFDSVKSHLAVKNHGEPELREAVRKEMEVGR